MLDSFRKKLFLEIYNIARGNHFPFAHVLLLLPSRVRIATLIRACALFFFFSVIFLQLFFPLRIRVTCEIIPVEPLLASSSETGINFLLCLVSSACARVHVRIRAKWRRVATFF
jgi:hypothetical protein